MPGRKLSIVSAILDNLVLTYFLKWLNISSIRCYILCKVPKIRVLSSIERESRGDVLVRGRGSGSTLSSKSERTSSYSDEVLVLIL